MSGSQEGGRAVGRGRDPRRLHTRLVVKCVEWDVGVRPISAYGYLSPSITFVPDPPLQAGVPAKVRVAVHNFGNMDATGVLLEVAYNLWIGNQAEGMQPIGNLTLPTIPADGHAHVFELDWTPPPTLSNHACVHARVFDSWSLQNETATVFLWDSLLNPQAGNRNFSLVPVQDAARAGAALPGPHFGRIEQRARVLMTAFQEDDRARLGEQAIFPLPFRLERLPAALLRAVLNPQPLPPGLDERAALMRQTSPTSSCPFWRRWCRPWPGAHRRRSSCRGYRAGAGPRRAEPPAVAAGAAARKGLRRPVRGARHRLLGRRRRPRASWGMTASA
jgi:hypothetical protein